MWSNVADCCKLWSKRGQAFAYSVKNAELCLNTVVNSRII